METARENAGANGASIVVVDDDPINCKLFGAILRRAGHRVRLASSGRDALALLAIEVPDLVLLDYMMPGLTGVETLTLVRADPRTKSLPVLMVTASSEDAHVEAGFAAGADDYIVKPVDARTLCARVASTLHGRRAASERDSLAAELAEARPVVLEATG